MGWKDTIQDTAPAPEVTPAMEAATESSMESNPSGPLQVTIHPLSSESATPPKQTSWRDTVQEDPNAPNPFVETFKHGAEDAGTLLGDSARFLTGQELSKQETPALDQLRIKHANGTADRHDYERAFLEGMGNSPGGKLLGAVGGLLPSINVATTSINKWINPYISEKTGIDPAELQLGEMALPFAGKATAETIKNPGLIKDFIKDEHGGSGPGPNSGNSKPYIPDFKMSSLPEVKLAGIIGRGSLSLASKGIKSGAEILKSAASPVTNAIVDTDNPLGGPGLANAFKSNTAQEGARLQDNIPGLKFSAGELTGNNRARGIEDTLANSSKWGDKFAKANSDKVNAITTKFGTILDSLHDKETIPDDFGGRLSTAYRGTLDNLKQTRREQAKVDFDTAFQGADDAGKYIQSNNLFRTLQELRDEGDARLLTDSKALGGKMAKSLLGKLAVKTQKGNEMADNLTIKELGNGLSDFGEDAANQEHPEAVRRVYARVYAALQKDLDAEIANPKGDPEKIGMLAVARDNYKNISDHISDIQKTTLGNLVGYADHNSQGQLVISPESIANKFNTLQPSELKTTLKFLDDNHPDVANMGRRYMLESVLRQAQDGVGLRGVGTTKPFAKAEFVKNLPKPDKLNALLGDNRAYDDVMDVAAATNRLIDYGAGQSGSQTFQRNNIFNAMYGLGKGALVKSIVSDNLAEDLLDPSKRHRMGVEARQSSKIFDNIKGFAKDQKGSGPGLDNILDFKAMKDKLGKMRTNASGPRGGVFDMNSLGQNNEMNALRQAMMEKMQPKNRLQNLNDQDRQQAMNPEPHGPLKSTADRLEWLKTHIHPDMIHEWTEGGKNPLHKWPNEDIDMMYEASQPTMGDIGD